MLRERCAHELHARVSSQRRYLLYFDERHSGCSHSASCSQVAGALAALQPAWNFTLMFVMGGAIAVALPLFQLIILKRDTALDGSKLAVSPSNQIDWKLLTGGVMFGAGWGIGGMCPGPAIVALAHPQPQIVAMVASMLVGMAVALRIGQNECAVPHGKRQAQAGPV
jgi:uncharacterized membrane protein YedE/YeeE